MFRQKLNDVLNCCTPWTSRGFAILLMICASFNTNGQILHSSNIKSDERIVFFTTDAALSEDKLHWRTSIHTWVHELDNAPIRRNIIAKLLEKKYGLRVSPETESNFNRRIRLIIADNERAKRIVVRIAGEIVALEPTEANGHSITEIQLSADSVNEYSQEGHLKFAAVLPKPDARTFTGTINFVEPTGVSVISDFDDTVKITEVTHRRNMLDRSLYRNFESVPGMAEAYDHWEEQGASFHYVSSSPWQLYEPIDNFLNEQGFPPRSLTLKSVRFKDETFANLFKSGLETKPLQILPILELFPERQFVLVGDSGEHDPEVYADIYRRFPDRILKILIRNVTNEVATNSRFTVAYDGIHTSIWELFDDPASIGRLQ